jgi:hypothetical protein
MWGIFYLAMQEYRSMLPSFVWRLNNFLIFDSYFCPLYVGSKFTIH